MQSWKDVVLQPVQYFMCFLVDLIFARYPSIWAIQLA